MDVQYLEWLYNNILSVIIIDFHEPTKTGLDIDYIAGGTFSYQYVYINDLNIITEQDERDFCKLLKELIK